jgi:GNAT superfamily N-acetyltransferase
MTPLPDGVTLREATLDDAERGAALHMACWREAYGPIVDGQRLAAHLSDPAGWAERWRVQLQRAPRLLAVRGDELVGFAVAGPGRDPDLPDTLELYAVYVRAAWYGRNVGQVLLDAVLGSAAAYLWVLEINARARAFYARNGFSPDGARERYDPLDAWEVRLMRDSMPA